VRLRLLKRLDVPGRSDLPVFAGYCLAAAVYIAIGVAYRDFLLSVIVGMAYLVLAAWLVPAAVRRLRR
jgi:branched-subunit amino acid transport protein